MCSTAAVCVPWQQRVTEVVRHGGDDLHELGRPRKSILGGRLPLDCINVDLQPCLDPSYQLLNHF
jgi:hypothetical protein